MTKYGNVPTTIDGRTFASKAEANRYAELKLLERAGEIAGLVCQPRYELQPAFVTRRGERVRAIWYVGDFEYTDNGQLCVEDVKGGKATQTAVFQLKRKLFLYLYPNVELRVLGGA
jgi:hypothetical protein